MTIIPFPSKNIARSSMTPFKEILYETFHSLEKRFTQPQNATIENTGEKSENLLNLLKTQISGLFEPGSLTIIDQHGMGKGHVAELLIDIAVNQKKTALLFCLDDHTVPFEEIMISMIANVSLYRLKRGNLSDSDWPRLTRAVGILSETNLHIDTKPTTLNHIVEQIGEFRQNNDLHYVIIEDTDQLNLHTMETLQKLRNIAHDCHMPIVLISDITVAMKLCADCIYKLGKIHAEQGHVTVEYINNRTDCKGSFKYLSDQLIQYASFAGLIKTTQ